MENTRRKFGNGLVEVTETQTCSRCGGTGKLPQFMHIQNGTCFKCWGQKKFLKKKLIL